MNARDDIDLVLADWLAATAPSTAPEGIHEAVIERARHARPRSSWLVTVRARLAGAASGPAMRLAYLALLAALLAAAILSAMLVGAPSRNAPAPPVGVVERVTAFRRPFEVTVPPESDLQQAAGAPVPGVIAWVAGSPAAARPAGDSGSETGQAERRQPRGIAIGSVVHAWTHLCGGDAGRAPVRSNPSELLADLRDIAGVGLGPDTPTTLDGRAAVAADIRPAAARCTTTDLHVSGSISGLAGSFLLLTLPSRVTAVEVDGVTAFVQIWARTAEDLAAWMPQAQQFVDSIHFIGRP